MDLRQRAAHDLFVHLRQLACQRGRAVAELGGGVGEARHDPMRGLEEDQGVPEVGEPAEERPPLAALRRREAGEGERMRWQPGDQERGERRRRAGNGLHPVAGGDRGAGEDVAGVGEQRRAGVRGDGDGLSLVERREDRARAGALVVLVQGNEGLLDPQVVEKQSRASRVFAGDEIGRRERRDGPRREIVEIPDGGRDEEEAAGHGRWRGGGPGAGAARRVSRAGSRGRG